MAEFQFHKGTIRTFRNEEGCALHSVLFQFHKGTIRTDHEGVVRQISLQFQFHKGTIRTVRWQREPLVSLYFNSIKVRLELEIIIKVVIYALFQFHKGTIRTIYQ